MSRSRRLVLLVGLTAAFAAGLSAPALADLCDKIPSIPLVPNPAKGACKVAKAAPEVVTDPGKAATDIATAPFRAASDAVMQGVTNWVADGAAWLVGQAGKLIDKTTTPQVQSPWFSRQYGAMAALAAIFALPLLFLSTIQAVARRDMSILTRAAFVHLPAAFLFTAMAVTVVSLLLTLTDQMSAQVAASAGSDAHSFFSDVTKALATLTAPTGSPATPLFAVFLSGLIAAVGAFFVWVELLIRSAAIYVAVLFLPFTFVAMIWPTTARWCRRLLELLFAIVFSKFVIVAILALAAAGLGQSRSDEAFQGVLAGAALLVLAAFSPFALLRLIPMVESAAHHSSRASGAGSQTLGPSMGPAAVMRRVADGNWGGGEAGGLRLAPAAVGGSVPLAAAATVGSGVRAGASAAAGTAGAGASGTHGGGADGRSPDQAAGAAPGSRDSTSTTSPAAAPASSTTPSTPAGPTTSTPAHAGPADSPAQAQPASQRSPGRPRAEPAPRTPDQGGGDGAR
jgi:hypothetical protein